MLHAIHIVPLHFCAGRIAIRLPDLDTPCPPDGHTNKLQIAQAMAAGLPAAEPMPMRFLMGS